MRTKTQTVKNSMAAMMIPRMERFLEGTRLVFESRAKPLATGEIKE